MAGLHVVREFLPAFLGGDSAEDCPAAKVIPAKKLCSISSIFLVLVRSYKKRENSTVLRIERLDPFPDFGSC